MPRQRLSIDAARRVAMAAQGFDRPRPSAACDARHFRRVMVTLGLLQLDYVNVLVPAHYLVLWSRLGRYSRSRFDRYVYGSGECTEQWAHEASIVPASAWPLLDYRRQRYEMHKNNPLRRLPGRKAYLQSILERVRRGGLLCAADLPAMPGPKRKPGDWHRSIPRWALEYHFARGDLAVSHRLPNFQRVFDLPERLLPAEHYSCSLAPDDARAELLRRAADSLGVATLRDLADYFRMSPKNVRPILSRLETEGKLSPVEVEGWQEPAWLSAGARLPRRIPGASLLSPFDPLVWYRPRAERLFGFHYRIEIYVPASQRKWGYYVLPFRVGDRIVARVDLKADRQQCCLRVNAVHREDGVPCADRMARLATELAALCDWLELDRIRVRRHNKASRQLAAAVAGITA